MRLSSMDSNINTPITTAIKKKADKASRTQKVDPSFWAPLGFFLVAVVRNRCCSCSCESIVALLLLCVSHQAVGRGLMAFLATSW